MDTLDTAYNKFMDKMDDILENTKNVIVITAATLVFVSSYFYSQSEEIILKQSTINDTEKLSLQSDKFEHEYSKEERLVKLLKREGVQAEVGQGIELLMIMASTSGLDIENILNKDEITEIETLIYGDDTTVEVQNSSAIEEEKNKISKKEVLAAEYSDYIETRFDVEEEALELSEFIDVMEAFGGENETGLLLKDILKLIYKKNISKETLLGNTFTKLSYNLNIDRINSTQDIKDLIEISTKLIEFEKELWLDNGFETGIKVEVEEMINSIENRKQELLIEYNFKSAVLFTRF